MLFRSSFKNVSWECLAIWAVVYWYPNGLPIIYNLQENKTTFSAVCLKSAFCLSVSSVLWLHGPGCGQGVGVWGGIDPCSSAQTSSLHPTGLSWFLSRGQVRIRAAPLGVWGPPAPSSGRGWTLHPHRDTWIWTPSCSFLKWHWYSFYTVGHLNNIHIGSIFCSKMRAILLDSVLFYSVLFYSVLLSFCSVLFYFILFYSIQFYSIFYFILI